MYQFSGLTISATYQINNDNPTIINQPLLNCIMKKIYAAAILATTIATPSFAQGVYIGEPPTNIRFEQYTGATGEIVFWRLPSPGSSTFPGTTCASVKIPNDRVEHASRFMALYLFAKNSGKNIFYIINASNCIVVSFGIDG